MEFRGHLRSPWKCTDIACVYLVPGHDLRLKSPTVIACSEYSGLIYYYRVASWPQSQGKMLILGFAFHNLFPDASGQN